MTQIKLGEQVVDLSGTMPSVGSKAPDFLFSIGPIRHYNPYEE